MAEHRQAPTEFRAPSEAELKARNKRNVAIATGLVIFMVFVFVTMISRSMAG